MEKIIGKPRQLDNRNRVTLSPEILKLLDLKTNDYVYFRMNKGKLIMGKALVKYEFIEEIANRNKK